MASTLNRDMAVTLNLVGLDALIKVLNKAGFEVYGPTVANGVIGHDRIDSLDDLPHKVTDEQSGGHYRLVDRDDGARFGYAVGPGSWKDVLHPSRVKVWTLTREPGTVAVSINKPEPVPRAFVGVRPCELAAIRKQDRVLAHGPHPDPVYQINRHDTVIVVVNCGDPADTCFCTSTGTGPAAAGGYDLALTELVDGARIHYVVDVGSERGARLMAMMPPRTMWPTTTGEHGRAEQVTAKAADTMTARLDTDLADRRVADLLYDNLESDQWDDIARRCLTCGNCTLACPTCFCTNMEDVTDLSGAVTDRWRVWDTCFSLEFSHMGPGPVRAAASSRYRQWLVHKLGSWHDQFRESGCVGCGRCITWCPVGIDLRDEITAMADGSGGA